MPLPTLETGASDDTSTTWNNNFVDYTTGDFRVKDSSADIYDTASAASAPATDIIGTARPQGSADDIGAWELVVVAGHPAVKRAGGVGGMHSLSPIGNYSKSIRTW